MSVRKRRWTTRKGGEKEAWIVDYVDQQGDRHIETFERKKDADAFEAGVKVDVRAGTHTPDSKSITVGEAGELWIGTGEQNGLERTTLNTYRQHLNFHIRPLLGRVKLSQLSTPLVRKFEDDLRAGALPPSAQIQGARSAAITKKIRGSLGSILADAQERGHVARNVVRDLRARRGRGKERKAERRAKGKLKVGVDIPTPAEIRSILGHLQGRYGVLIRTAIFTGLRSSELRGLRWEDVDFKRGEIHVRQRADAYRVIGAPKSETSERTLPIPPQVANALREWKLASLAGELGLVFSNGSGNVESHANIINRGLLPAMVAAGVTAPSLDEKGKPVKVQGKPVVEAKYTGLHALRHFYASWCINRPEDGGLGLLPKMVQERLGHSTIQMTLDVYGHLFPRGDDGRELAGAEKLLTG